MDFVVHLFEQAGIVWSALGALVTLIAAVLGWKPVKRWLSAVGAFFKGMSKVGDMDDKINKVLKEVLPNGGSSLRDSINRTETAVTVLINTTRAQWDALGMFGIFEANAQGEYRYVNNELQRWVNHTEAEMLGYGWVNSVALSDRERVRNEWDSCMEDARTFMMDFLLRRADGSEFSVLCTASPVAEYAGGPVMKWVGVVRRQET